MRPPHGTPTPTGLRREQARSVISTVPPAIIRPFAEARDAVVVHCLEAIQEHELSDSSTHALPAGAGRASLHSMMHHEGGSHLGTYYRIDGPLIARVLMMGGATPRRAAAHLFSPLEQADRGGWAAHLLKAHQAAVDLCWEFFTHDDLHITFLLPPPPGG